MLIGTVVLFDIWVGVVVSSSGNSIQVARNDGVLDNWLADNVSVVCTASNLLKQLGDTVCKQAQ